ncbi:hypothetical protein K438DRAFT_636781 [Mycena galopus ATCC 62051]|nr:hypothetical protein K438DRAFT_636781 [Mycena galopus ATCC 62051]
MDHHDVDNRIDEDDHMPELQSVSNSSDSEDSDAGLNNSNAGNDSDEDAWTDVAEDMPPLEPIAPASGTAERRRRRKGDDEDGEQDSDRDRRHPSMRVNSNTANIPQAQQAPPQALPHAHQALPHAQQPLATIFGSNASPPACQVRMVIMPTSRRSSSAPRHPRPKTTLPPPHASLPALNASPRGSCAASSASVRLRMVIVIPPTARSSARSAATAGV